MFRIKNTEDAMRFGRSMGPSDMYRVIREKYLLERKFDNSIKNNNLGRASSYATAVQLRNEALSSYKNQADFISAMDFIYRANGYVSGVNNGK